MSKKSKSEKKVEMQKQFSEKKAIAIKNGYRPHGLKAGKNSDYGYKGSPYAWNTEGEAVEHFLKSKNIEL